MPNGCTGDGHRALPLRLGLRFLTRPGASFFSAVRCSLRAFLRPGGPLLPAGGDFPADDRRRKRGAPGHVCLQPRETEGGREGDGEGETDRQRQTGTEREREVEGETETEGGREGEGEGERDRQTETEREREVEGERERKRRKKGQRQKEFRRRKREREFKPVRAFGSSHAVALFAGCFFV